MALGAKIYGSVYLRGFKVWKSYRTQAVLILLSFLLPIFVYFFVGASLGGTISLGSTVRNYTSFFVVGLAFQPFMTVSVSTIGSSLRDSAVNGTIEYYLLTPTGLLSSVIWASSWFFLLSVALAILLLSLGQGLGASFRGADILGALLLTVMLLVSGIGIALMAGGVVLVSKAGDPVQFFFVAFSTLLSGTVFPVNVMPSWLANIAYLLPLTWALNGMRDALILGAGLVQLTRVLSIMFMFDIVTIVLGFLVFRTCFDYARTRGTLAEY